MTETNQPLENTLTSNEAAEAADSAGVVQTDKRDELRAKIEASERRIEERTLADQAREAAESAADYAKANPMTVIAGAVAIGLAIGLATKPGRRVVRRAADRTGTAFDSAARSTKHVAQDTADEASRLGTIVSDAVLAYGMKLIDSLTDTARAGGDALEDFGDTAATKARQLRRDAGYSAGSAAERTGLATRRAKRKASRALRDTKSSLAH